MKTKLLVLLFLSSPAFASFGPRHHEDVMLPSAAEARTKAAAARADMIQCQTESLWIDAKEAINNSIHNGVYKTSFRITGFQREAVHSVNELLRHEGYKCEIFYSRVLGEDLDIISWGK